MNNAARMLRNISAPAAMKPLQPLSSTRVIHVNADRRTLVPAIRDGHSQS
jgi:hypothetical protein